MEMGDQLTIHARVPKIPMDYPFSNSSKAATTFCLIYEVFTLKQQQKPLGSSEPIGLGPDRFFSDFCSPPPDTSLRYEFLGSGLVNRGNVPVVAASQNCSAFCIPTHRGMLG